MDNQLVLNEMAKQKLEKIEANRAIQRKYYLKRTEGKVTHRRGAYRITHNLPEDVQQYISINKN
jgi:hypothetical protein